MPARLQQSCIKALLMKPVLQDIGAGQDISSGTLIRFQLFSYTGAACNGGGSSSNSHADGAIAPG